MVLKNGKINWIHILIKQPWNRDVLNGISIVYKILIKKNKFCEIFFNEFLIELKLNIVINYFHCIYVFNTVGSFRNVKKKKFFLGKILW